MGNENFKYFVDKAFDDCGPLRTYKEPPRKRPVCVYNQFGELISIRESCVQAGKLDADGHSVYTHCRYGIPYTLYNVKKLFIFEDAKQPTKEEIVSLFWEKTFGYTPNEQHLMYENNNFNGYELCEELNISLSDLYRNLLNDNKNNILINYNTDEEKLIPEKEVKYWKEGDENLSDIEYLKKYYHVTKDGQVFSKVEEQDTPITQSGLKNPNTYLTVLLWSREYKFKQQFHVHRLVAMWYLPDYDENLCVNHIDGDRHNNNLDNLEMATQAWNTYHALHVLKLGETIDAARKNFDERNNKLVNKMIDRLRCGFNANISDDDEIVPNIVGRIQNKQKYDGPKWKIGKYSGMDCLSRMLNASILAIDSNNIVYICKNLNFAKSEGFAIEKKSQPAQHNNTSKMKINGCVCVNGKVFMLNDITDFTKLSKYISKNYVA